MADIAVAVALALVDKVLSFIDQELSLHKNVHDDVEYCRNWLRTMHAYLKDTEGKERSEGLKDRVTQVRDVAYDIEDILDEFMLHMPRQFHRHKLSKKAQGFVHFATHRSTLNEMSSKIKKIREKIDYIKASDSFRVTISEEGVEHQVTHLVPEEDEIVGFEEPREKLIHYLMNGESRRMTTWVVGPVGSGKTSLVRNVYESTRALLGRFDCHAWVHVSRSCKIEEILRSMLMQVCEGNEELIPRGGVETREKLHSYLQQKRYIVVLDDIWSQDDWVYIENALPKRFGTGSRIIVTTRNSGVASLCVESSHDHIHKLNGLPWQVAWGLFCKKAFPTSNGICPPELEELSKKIVKWCQGLPHAIRAVGKILSKKHPLPIEWKKVLDSLGSEIGTHANLPISYNDLPSNLKSCFLYFCILPEDYSIKRGSLIRLWVAEGFVKETSSKTVEDVAEHYLNELIGRNLVQASGKADFDGRIRSCRVLNLVREFLVLKSEEENFVKIFTETNHMSSGNIRRLSIHNAFAYLSRSRGLDCVRSAFVVGWESWDNSCQANIGKTLGDFRLLRVLDLQGAPLGDFPEDIVHLTLLRYLSLRQTNIKTVPRSIKKLSFLETLDLKQTYVTKLPKEILELHCLRNLLVYRYDVTNYVTFGGTKGVEIFAVEDLPALQKLSLIRANKHGRIIKELGKLIQLRKLGIIDLKKKDGRNLCASIQKMQKLSTLDVRSRSEQECLDLDDMLRPPTFLQRLYLKGCLQNFPAWICSLHSLVRIGLKWSRLKDNPLNALQALPNLMELQMVAAYTGDTLEFEAKMFGKLKILHIEQFNRLNTVVVQVGALPKLQKLTISTCEKLKMLPLGLSNIAYHLEELLLYDMPEEFIARLSKSSEERWMVGNIPLIRSFTRGSNLSLTEVDLS